MQCVNCELGFTGTLINCVENSQWSPGEVAKNQEQRTMINLLIHKFEGCKIWECKIGEYDDSCNKVNN